MEKHLVITVHGIRTYGPWQKRLEALIKEQDPDAEVHHYRYDWFDVFRLLFLPARWSATRRFRRWFLNSVHHVEWHRIDIVAHSFGTYLAAATLRSVPVRERPLIHTLILAGSVLKPSFDWTTLTKTVKRVVNDCGTRDKALLASHFFVPRMGMAGRCGFTGMESNQFRNRFFPYEHSDYFKEGVPHGDHMRKYWIPLLTEESDINGADCRKTPGMLGALRQTILRPAPAVIVFVGLISIIFYVNRQRLTAIHERNEASRQRDEANEQRRTAEAERQKSDKARARAEEAQREAERRSMISASQAAAARSVAESATELDDERSALLAREAYLISTRYGGDALASADNALRTILGRPRFITRFRIARSLGAMDVSSDNSLLAIAPTDQTTVQIQDLNHLFREPRKLKPELKYVDVLGFLESGRELVAVSRDGIACRWNLQNEKEAKPINIGRGLTYALDTVGERIAYADFSGRVHVVSFDQPNNTILGDLSQSALVSRLKFNKSGNLLASIDAQGRVTVFDLHAHSQTVWPVTINMSGRVCLDFGRDSTLVIADASSTIFKWSQQNSKLRSYRSNLPSIDALAAMDAENLFVSGGEGLLELTGDQLNVRWRAPLAYHVYSLVVSGRGSQLCYEDTRGEIGVINLGTLPGAPQLVANHAGSVQGLSLSAQGDRLAFQSRLKIIQVNWLGEKRPPATFDISSLVKPDGSGAQPQIAITSTKLAAAGVNQTLIWDLDRSTTAQIIRTHQPNDVPDSRVEMDELGRQIAISTSRSISLWKFERYGTRVLF